MTRARTPTIHCDYDTWGGCDNWDVDFYACTVTSVDGIRMTTEQWAPGWVTTSNDKDFCPEHHPDGSAK